MYQLNALFQIKFEFFITPLFNSAKSILMKVSLTPI